MVRLKVSRMEPQPLEGGCGYFVFEPLKRSRQISRSGVGIARREASGGRAKVVAERRIELLVSRLSIECFEPTKLLRNGAENSAMKLVRTAGLEPAMNWV